MTSRWLGRAAAVLGVVALSAAPSLAQTTHVVTVSGFDFVPEDITIQQGDSIMWTNLAAGFHNVVETDCPANGSSVDNGGFNSGIAGAVDTYTLQFNDVGTFCYICEPHVPLDMFGSVTVQAGTGVPTMGEWGLIALGGLLMGLGCVVLMKRHREALALNG